MNINDIINQALVTAIQQVTLPMQEQISALQLSEAGLRHKIENQGALIEELCGRMNGIETRPLEITPMNLGKAVDQIQLDEKVHLLEGRCADLTKILGLFVDTDDLVHLREQMADSGLDDLMSDGFMDAVIATLEQRAQQAVDALKDADCTALQPDPDEFQHDVVRNIVRSVLRNGSFTTNFED